jgi:glycosyltransferase involved in cell wall biosynthesis
LQRGLRNVTRLPWVPIRQLVPYLYASDVLVIPPSAAPLVDYGRTVLPLKTYLYLAAGRPILAPALSDTKGVLNPENAALVEPDCPDDAQHTIERLMSDHDWAHALGKQAKIDSERYTWQKRAQRIVGFLEGRLRAREE